MSPYLHDVAACVGDRIEVRGPIGGYFVWDVALGGPLLLVGGRLGRRAADGDAAPPRASRRRRAGTLLYSSRTCDDVIYRDELETGRGARRPAGHPHADPLAAARLDRLRPPHRRAMLAEVIAAAGPDARGLHLRPDRAGRGRRQRLVELGLPPAGFGPSASDRPGHDQRGGHDARPQ